MKIRMKHYTIVSASVLIFSHGVVDDLVNFRGSVKDGQESLDDFLIVGDVLFGLDVSWGLFDDFADGVRKVWDDLDL